MLTAPDPNTKSRLRSTSPNLLRQTGRQAKRGKRMVQRVRPDLAPNATLIQEASELRHVLIPARRMGTAAWLVTRFEKRLGELTRILAAHHTARLGARGERTIESPFPVAYLQPLAPVTLPLANLNGGGDTRRDAPRDPSPAVVDPAEEARRRIRAELSGSFA